MAWIESNQELGRHPKTKKLARLLDTSVVTVVGHLHYLWWWAMDFAQDGDLSKYDEFEIADACMWAGEPALFVDALIKAGFIDKTELSLFIHDWFEYAGRLIIQKDLKREKTRERVKRFRDKARWNSEVNSLTQLSNDDANRTKERCNAAEMCDADVNKSVKKCNDEVNPAAEISHADVNESAEMGKAEVSPLAEANEGNVNTSAEASKAEVNISAIGCKNAINSDEICNAEVIKTAQVCNADVMLCNAPTLPNRTLPNPTLPNRTPPNQGAPNLYIVDYDKARLRAGEIGGCGLPLENPLANDKRVNAPLRAGKIDSGTSCPAPAELKLIETNRPEKSRVLGTEAVEWAEENWGRMIPKGDADSILAWCDEFATSGSKDPVAVVIEGLKCCLDADARNMRYLRAVLTDWWESGILSVEQIKAREAEYKSKKNRLRNKELRNKEPAGKSQFGISQSGKTESSKYANFYL